MTPDTLYYAFSTIAQCAAALAAFIGFFGLWRLDLLREAETLAKRGNPPPYIRPDSVLTIAQQREAYQRGQLALIPVLITFLLGTLVFLFIAIVLLAFVDALVTWVWTMRMVICLAGLWLGGAPAYVMLRAVGRAGPIRRFWSRSALRVRYTWTRVSQWCGLALSAERLRARWRRQ
jgi:hypothetical protein